MRRKYFRDEQTGSLTSVVVIGKLFKGELKGAVAKGMGWQNPVRIKAPEFKKAVRAKSKGKLFEASDHLEIYCPRRFCFTRESERRARRALERQRAAQEATPETGQEE